MRYLRPLALTSLAVLTITTLVSGQQQAKPGTIDDLLTELRGLRADFAKAKTDSIRTQLLTSRVVLQELRISTMSQQLSGVQQQMAENRLTLAPFADQLKQAQDSNSQIFAPIRNTLEQVENRDRVLQAQESELTRQITTEQDRWRDLAARLDEMERSLAR